MTGIENIKNWFKKWKPLYNRFDLVKTDHLRADDYLEQYFRNNGIAYEFRMARLDEAKYEDWMFVEFAKVNEEVVLAAILCGYQLDSCETFDKGTHEQLWLMRHA